MSAFTNGACQAMARPCGGGGKLTMRKPSGDAGDNGYVVEQVDWFDCVLPDDLVPANQDGEVAQFELLDKRSLIFRLEQNEFTTEAALVLVAALDMPCPARPPAALF